MSKEKKIYGKYLGRRFGKLVAIEKLENGFWLYKCDCGEHIKVWSYKIHQRKSCGCLLKENALKVQYNRRKFDKVTESSEYLIYKNNSLQRGFIPLGKEDWIKIVYQNCFYCGEIDRRNRATAKSYLNSRGKSLKEGDLERYAININGIDRIDSLKGYEEDNCIPCCGMCNRMKNNFTSSLFMDKIKKIYEKHNL